MPAREPVLIVEQRAQVIDDLTEDEAAALHELGRQLRGSGERHRVTHTGTDDDTDDDDESGGESVDSREEEEDQRTAIVVSRRPNATGWSVSVRNAIGAVSVGDRQILVSPKIPSAHFAMLAMLAVDSEAARVADGTLQLEADESALPAVWLTFLDALALTLRADLHHDYVEVADDPPFVRGRLDPRATVVNLARGRLRFPAVFEDLSVDNPVNRTLRSACLAVENGASAVARSLAHAADAPQYLVHRRIERRARESSYHLSQAGDLQPGDLLVEIPRLAVHQRRALIIARHILTGVGRSVRVGECRASCFLQPTPSIAEAAIRNLLGTELGSGTIVSKRGRKVAGLSFNPDLVVRRNPGSPSEMLATGDVKYRLRSENWPRRTLEQAITFRQVFGAQLGFFVDFATDDGGDGDQEINIGGVKFHRLSWPARESVTPGEAAARVVTSCRTFLGGDV